VDFHTTLERLCLLSYGKVASLDYRRQMEEYEKESRHVALNMIQACPPKRRPSFRTGPSF
jgi:hypothetical protein